MAAVELTDRLVAGAYAALDDQERDELLALLADLESSAVEVPPPP